MASPRCRAAITLALLACAAEAFAPFPASSAQSSSSFCAPLGRQRTNKSTWTVRRAQICATATRVTSLGADADLQAAHFYGFGNSDHKPSILQNITAQRYRDVEEARRLVSEDHLREEIAAFDKEYGGPIDLFDRIRQEEPRMALAAEFKRASPSKGDIAPDMVSADQGVLYASAGAAVLSVLTEPKWFKGTLRDMRDVRVATQALGGNRPAVLRKDFVVDEYMVLEARANGADTVLLIVAILELDRLARLMAFCREHGMEPLVEVHTDEEMAIALDAGARVIGVNNRNLHTFELDMATTERVARVAVARGVACGPRRLNGGVGGDESESGEVQLAALSGIVGRADVKRFADVGVSLVLLGETLMRAEDPRRAIRALLGDDEDGGIGGVGGGGGGGNGLMTAGASEGTAGASAVGATAKTATGRGRPFGKQVVKICGVTNAADARAAAAAGANLIGVIFAEKSKRRVTPEAAAAVVAAVRAFGERRERRRLTAPPPTLPELKGVAVAAEWFRGWAAELAAGSQRTPLVVGVFQDQPIEEVRAVAERVGLDLVQLHGDEGLEACADIGVPTIRAFFVPADVDGAAATAESRAAAVLSQLRPNFAAAVLLDTSVGAARGGTGVAFDLAVARIVQEAGVPVILAGGLDAENVGAAVVGTGAWGVDVSGGTEAAPGVKDPEKVRRFVAAARRAYPPP